LTLKNLVILIISFKSSIQRELDSFFKALSQEDFNIRKATKGAFTQARAKLDPSSFQRLNEVAVNTFYDQAEHYVWHDMRVLAVDGTRLMLPNHPSIIEEFGQHSFGPHADRPRSMAIGSMLYDVLNQITIDARMGPYKCSEKDLLLEHLDYMKPGDLLLLDRGYPSFWLFFLLKAKGIEFCVRLKDDWWLSVKDFMRKDVKEQIVAFSLPKKDYKMLAGFPHMLGTTITCRFVKVEHENGTNQVLCTSLIDDKKYQYDEFGELYHCRWDEEEAYKLLKCRVEVENFSGKTARAVRQDFYAKAFLMTLCAAYAHPIADKVAKEYKADQTRKHDQQINRTSALSMTMNVLIPLFLRKKITETFEAFDHIVENTREIIRPGRINPRNSPQKKRMYSMIYKRL